MEGRESLICVGNYGLALVFVGAMGRNTLQVWMGPLRAQKGTHSPNPKYQRTGTLPRTQVPLLPAGETPASASGHLSPGHCTPGLEPAPCELTEQNQEHPQHTQSCPYRSLPRTVPPISIIP